MPKDILRVGFFHFTDDDKCDPVKSLSTELTASSSERSLDDCLLVIPEAFNIRGGYHNQDGRYYDGTIAEALTRLSKEFDVALVAGLIDEGTCERPGCNSAYLMDGEIRTLLSRKMENDGTGNYTPSALNCDRPVTHRGVRVATLICMDANLEENDNRRHMLLHRVNELGAAPAFFVFRRT